MNRYCSSPFIYLLLAFGAESLRIRRSDLSSLLTNGTTTFLTPNTNNNPRILAPWPGQQNQVPFMSHWGAWTDQQQRQGMVPPAPNQVANRAIQISPAQAHWYPNGPEYHGFDGNYLKQIQALSNQLVPQIPSANNNTAIANVFHWNPVLETSTNFGPAVFTTPVEWSTWSRIQNQGVQGGILQTWVNWYQNPDPAAQGVEYVSEKQRQSGWLPGGKPVPQEGRIFPDDTDKILVDILAGFVAGSTPKKAAMHNMRTFYTQYRRNYWVGKRFYKLDPQSEIESYQTCSFNLPQDVKIQYEIDDSRVEEIVFQCVKYQETCCKLNCCDMRGRPLYYTSFFGQAKSNFQTSLILILSVAFFVLFV